MVRVVARRGIDPAWIRELARAGGSETWYVVERPVPATEWLRSFDTTPHRQRAPGRPNAGTDGARRAPEIDEVAVFDADGTELASRPLATEAPGPGA